MDGPNVKRVYITKAVIIGAVLALVVGGLAATLSSSSRERVDDSPFTVPHGRVGDRAAYAYFSGHPNAERDWTVDGLALVGRKAATDHSSAADSSKGEGDLTARGLRTYEVADVVVAYDAAHERRDALLVHHNHTLPDVDEGGFEVVEHVDLGHRQVFRRDHTGLPAGDPRVQSFGLIQYSDFQRRHASLPGLEYQGMELELGRVVADRAMAVPPELASLIANAHERISVVDRSLIDGVDAYAVRHEITYQTILPSIGTPMEPENAPESKSAALDQMDTRIQAWRVDWMSASHPYAVLTEAGVAVAFGENSEPTELVSHRVAQSLKSLDRGESFIPWREASVPWGELRTDLGRGPPDQVFPADGQGSSLAYELEDAKATVEADATLLQFYVWRQANPTHRLVGARYVETSVPELLDTVGVARWQLQFAAPSGAAFVVSTERQVDATGTAHPASRNQAIGPTQVPSFSLDDLPRQLPTIAALERTWADYVSAEALAGQFNYVAWGMVPGGSAADCPTGAMVAFDATGIEASRFIEGGSNNGCQWTASQSDGTRASLVVMNVESGRVEAVYESEFGYSLTRIDGVSADEARRGWSKAASTVRGGVEPPEPEETAATGMGFLALFLAAYFWPTIKFVSAKAFLVVGYAKIKKDQVLNNSIRESILQLIRGTPGIHASDIARQSRAGWGTIVYHLSVLEKNKMVTSLVDGRHKRFFPSDTVDYSKRGQLAALMNANTRQIYELIEAEPGIVQGQIAGRVDLTIPTVIWHLQRLQGAGLVGRDKDGRKYRYFSNPAYQPKGAQSGDDAEGMEVQ